MASQNYPPSRRLVDYSDSESSDADVAPPPPKLQKRSNNDELPPLPARFHNLYAVPPRVGKEDDPTLHGGRKRSIPHVQGNWPTHVFVEWHLSRAEFDTLDHFYAVAVASSSSEDAGFKLESHLKSDLGCELPLHLSLSRPNVLRTEQREGFLETLEERLGKARIKPFTVEFPGLEWVANNDRTRWFLVLRASHGGNTELPRLLQLTNSTFAVFGQPPLYSPHGGNTNGSHVSLAWSLTEPSADVQRVVEDKLGVGSGGVVLKGKGQSLRMEVNSIRVKIGNALHIVELGAGKPAATDSGGGGTRKRKASLGE